MEATQYPAVETVAAFGGPSKMAAALGVQRQNIGAWMVSASGLIPRWWTAKVKAAAEAEKVKLPKPYLFGVHLPKPSKRKASK